MRRARLTLNISEVGPTPQVHGTYNLALYVGNEGFRNSSAFSEFYY